MTLNVQNKKEQNKSGEINERHYSKSATKKRKILKDRSKNNIKISFKSDSKNNIKENLNIYKTNNI